MRRIDTATDGWGEYELLDSGDGRKLERFGALTLDRPDPQAIWAKTAPDTWAGANAQFLWTDKDEPASPSGAGERWKLAEGAPEEWEIAWKEIMLHLSFKGFKHIGIFPEHVGQWEELKNVCGSHHGCRVLNLFGYTGAASIVAAQAGANVTHVDASKQTIATLKENMKRSALSADAIRTVCEDALKYAKRLVERGEQFETIIMDPPAFGRGPKGEVWKIEEKLSELIALVLNLLSKDARLVILNGYASGYSARSLGELLSDAMK